MYATCLFAAAPGNNEYNTYNIEHIYFMYLRHRFFLTVLTLIFSVSVFAQSCPSPGTSNITITTTVATPINVCGDAGGFTISIQNKSTFNLFNLSINPNMPVGMTFVPGSQSSVATVLTAVPLNNPTFSIASLAASSTVSFTYRAKAGCDIISYLSTPGKAKNNLANNNTAVSYTIAGTCNTENEVNGSTSYLIDYAVIGLDQSYTQNPSINIGQLLNRPVKINNTGTGNIDTLMLTITYPSQLKNRKLSIVSGTTLIPLTVSTLLNGVYTFVLTGTQFAYAVNGAGAAGNGDGNFDPDESLVLQEQVQGVDCRDNNETVFTASWGCNQQNCNPGNTPSSVSSVFYHASVPTAAPNITIVQSNTRSAITSLCVNNGGKDMELKYYNYQGNTIDTLSPNTARDISIQIQSDAGIIALSAFQIWNGKTLSYVSLPAALTQTANNASLTFANNAVVFGYDIDGAGFGLEDLDNDGYYDDLGVGMYVQLKFHYSYVSCLYTNITCRGFDADLLTSSLSYNSQCLIGASNTQLDINEYAGDYGDSNITGPIDVVDGSINVFTFKIDYYYNTSVGFHYFSCDPNTATNYRSEIVLPAGFSYVGNTVNWVPAGGGAPVSFTCTFVASTHTLIINGGGLRGSYSIPLTLNCAQGS